MLQTAFGASCMNRASVFEWLTRLKEGRDSVRDDERYGRSKKVNKPQLIGQRLGLGLLCWGFKGVQQEIPWEEASTHQIKSVAFPPGQCTSPQLHPCHRLFEQGGHQDHTLPIVQTLFPVTFGYSLSSEAVVLDDWGDERGCDAGYWPAPTRRLPWGLPDVAGTVEQVHCSRKRLLRRGLEFHMYTIHKSAHTKNLETYHMHLVFIWYKVFFISYK